MVRTAAPSPSCPEPTTRAGAGELAALVDEIEATAADESCGDMEEGGIKSLRNLWNRSATFVGMVRRRPFRATLPLPPRPEPACAGLGVCRQLDKDPVTVVAENALGSGSGPGGGGSPPEHNHVVSMIATATAPGAGGEAAHLDFLPMEVDEELLRDGVIELPLFITTALYCLSGGVAEIVSPAPPCRAPGPPDPAPCVPTPGVSPTDGKKRGGGGGWARYGLKRVNESGSPELLPPGHRA